ncbi:hypothetical protein [Chelativorans intermedius]|uniref:Uncharacterized protein n=1 Tax=Chelativorans intermedius TaxID=515947 RepID=A0ABV6D9V0_9HYPH|nr:hypothetical protein [Chelativorans intermedius]MCT8997838.1 hypothetical protein [Chelativorans intermedius]
MARNFVKLALAALLATAAAAAAVAQPIHCGARGEMVKVLSERFEERQRGYGLVGNRAIVELFLSPAGTWTILLTGPDRRTCIVAAGTEWEEIPVPPGHDVGWRRN